MGPLEVSKFLIVDRFGQQSYTTLPPQLTLMVQNTAQGNNVLSSVSGMHLNTGTPLNPGCSLQQVHSRPTVPELNAHH